MLGILSDKMSRIRVITIAQLITLAGMVLLLFVPLNANLFFVAVACVAFSFGGHHYRLPLPGERLLRPQQPDQELRVIYLGFGLGSIIGLHRGLSVWRLYGDLQPDSGFAGSGPGALPHHTAAGSRCGFCRTDLTPRLKTSP